LLAIDSVFSTLMGASVAAGASVGAGASVTGASVACGPAGATVGAAGAHAVTITSAMEIKIIEILRFD
jgi:hypothetical protein